MSVLSAELMAASSEDSVARRAGILGMAAFLPEGVLSNADLETMVETSDTWIMERTGIRLRHKAGSGETVSMMGTRAARVAMERAGVTTVDVIVTATCSPDTLVPSAATLIQRKLGLDGVPAFDLNAACSGFMYGLTVAESLIVSGVANTVLLVAAEAMTSLVDFGDRSTCVLFGDGAGAAVLGVVGSGGIKARRWGAQGAEAEMIYFGPKQEDEDSEDRVRMLGKGTYRIAVERLCQMAEKLCADAGWSINDVDLVVPHQANLRIIEAAAKRLGVGMDRVFVNVDQVGNTSAASIALALAQAEQSGKLKDGDRVVAMAFGAGTTWGGVAMEWGGR